MIEHRSNEGIKQEVASRTVTGYASIFNSESNDLGGFTEIISPTAFNEVIDKSDVFALLDHNKDRGVLARSTNGEGSLKLSIDEKGLKYSFEAPNTALGDEILEGIRRGDIRACSFAFTVAEGGDKWEKRANGTYLRTINQVDRLYDVSVVYCPAYDATTVKADSRGLEILKEEEQKEEARIAEEIRKEELANYFKELRKGFKK